MAEIEITNNKSGVNLDYDAISPFTGNKCVLIEADTQTNLESRICMETGYTTRDVWKVDSDSITTYENYISTLMKETKYIDHSLDQIWYLATMTTPVAVLYPVGTSKKDYSWEVSKIVILEGKERENYPVPGKEGEFYTSRLDTDNASKFEQDNFASAIDHFYSILSEPKEGNED